MEGTELIKLLKPDEVDETEFTYSETQQEILDTIPNSDPRCYMVTGGAGTGKTTVIKELVRRLEEQGENVFVCASTGVAAKLYDDGMTVHRAFRISPGSLANTYSENLPIAKASVIIIDEISMVDSILMDLILDRIEHECHPIKPTLVLCGDTAQLPPVIAHDDHNKRSYIAENFSKVAYFYAPENLKRIKEIYKKGIKMFELDVVFRQQGDDKFLQLLDNIRNNKDLLKVANTLNKHCSGKTPNDDVIRVFTSNKEVFEHNKAQLDKLPGRTFVSEMEIKGEVNRSDMGSTPEKLFVKVGARVMVTQNIYRNIGEESELLAANGEKGWVEDIDVDNETITVSMDSGQYLNITHTVSKVEKILKRSKEEMTKYEETYGKSFSVRQGKYYSNMVGAFKQIPLTLAWACTIHKSQGQTFNEVHINFKRPMRGKSLAYVALSRATNLDGITFDGKVRSTDLNTCKPLKKKRK